MFPSRPVLVRILLGAVALVPALSLSARQQAPAPRHVSAPGGEVGFTGIEGEQRAYDQYHYAMVRRAGDYIYVSGTVVRRPEGAAPDVATFKTAARATFQRIQSRLAVEGVGFADVVMINSFHVWHGPDFTGSKEEQFKAFGEVKDEFVAAPYPSWTAVGTTELLGDHGIVEVQMIAYAPLRPGAGATPAGPDRGSGTARPAPIH